MPDIKQYSTGRLGNTWPRHPETDHVNTKGLDPTGQPGIEAYIDEDIVRAYDDNRPVANLVYNDEMLSFTADNQAKAFDLNAYIKEERKDWDIKVGSQAYFTDPEDFTRQIQITPLRVARGTAYLRDSGYATNTSKVIIGFERSNGTTLYIEENIWFEDNTPLVDDPDTSYSGFYRPIYTGTPESKMPSDFDTYQITLRQINTTGNVYTYPIFTNDDFLIPYSSSIFNIENEPANFLQNSQYPGYDYYPNTYSQLSANNMGTLEVSQDSDVTKALRREGHKLLGSSFLLEGGGYKAELTEDAFRNNKSASLNRIENDVNFIRAITGVKQYNNSAKVYFSKHNDILNALVPLDTERDFLGDQDYIFSVTIEDQLSDEPQLLELRSPQTRGYQEFGLSIVDPSIAIGASGTYNHRVLLNNDIDPITASVSIAAGDNLYDVAEKLHSAFLATTPKSIWAYPVVVESGGSYDIRVYSKSAGSYSKISQTLTGSSDLRPALGPGTFESAVDATTHAEVWDFGQWPIYQDPADAPGTFQAVRSSGITTTNDFAAETIGAAIFDEMVDAGFDDFTVGIELDLTSGHNTELYIMTNGSTQGYQDLNMAVPLTNADSGLEPLSAYYFQLNINGEGFEEFVLNTTTDVSYQGVIDALNNTLEGVATVSFTPANDVRIASDAFGPDSSIVTADGVTGTSLFGYAYPAAGFTPVSVHGNSIAGTGKRVKVQANRIESFSIFEDTQSERAIFTYGSEKIYVTPNVETDTRDYVDTEHAYITRTSENRWSTQADRTFTVDMSNHSSWTPGATVTKLFNFTANSTNYLLVANSVGQIFYYSNGTIYDDYRTADDFTLLTDGDLGTNNEKVNNFFVYEDSVNSKLYLFVLTETYIYFTNVTSGLVAAQSFTAINTSSSLSVSNVTMPIFSEIYDAVDWEANVSSTDSNKYIVFVGKSSSSNWSYAPILYTLFDSSAETFTWYAEDRYWKTQIDDIASIVKYNGWEDPEQDYQLFIGNNANGPELWTGNSQNNTVDIGGPGDDKFNRFSWIETNLDGGNPLQIDNDITRINSLSVYDGRIFVASQRSEESVFGGLYSFAANKLQAYFERSASDIYVHPDGDSMFVHLYDDLLANSDPAIAKIFTERSDGRAQLFSSSNLLSLSGWPSNSSFRLTLEGFNVGGIIYDGEYDVVFDGNQGNIFDIVDYINGAQTTVGVPAGLSDAFVVSSGISGFDLSPIVRARVITNIEKSGNTYQTFYKIVIESKTGAPGEASGHSTADEVTQSNCEITISHPTQGTTVVGTGPNTLNIVSGTSALADLRMVDWNDAKLYQLKRVNTSGISFGGVTYIDISSQLLSGYKVLPGSLRVKANSTDELGFNQGRGSILEASTPTGLSNDSTVYLMKVTFNEDVTPAGTVEITDVTTPADVGSSLSGTYWNLYAAITSSPLTDYYVWYNVDGLSTDPAPAGKTGIEVLIEENSTDATVAQLTAEAIDESFDFSAISSGNVVTVTSAGVGSVTDAADVDAGVSVSVTQQGVDPGFTVEWVDVVGSAAQTMSSLITEINNDLTAGVASFEPLGGTAENVDIVITSNLIGDDSSVKLEQGPLYTYLLGYNGVDTIPNAPVQGSTALNTAGSQTVGFTWENTDYFLEEEHPGTGEVRIYIPNGATRISTGSTVWLDFWQYRELTKIVANGIAPTSTEWTYDLDEKKIVIGEAPNITAPEDVFFVDIKVDKTLAKLDLTTTIPSDQVELSNRFHATGPRDLENSDISIARPLARISSLHYGVYLWSTDDEDSVVSTYSFFLPRLDVVAVRKEVDNYGNRTYLTKGTPHPASPFVMMPLVNQNERALLYSTLVSSQDFNNNNIVQSPWATNKFEDTNRIYLSKDCHWFRPEDRLISTKGLRTRGGCADISRVSEGIRYQLVKTIEPLGIREPLKRHTDWSTIDNSKAIFVNSSNGNNSNNGRTPDTAVATIADAVSKASSARPYIMVMPTVQLNKDSYSAISVNRNFKIYIIAEHQISVPSVSISSEVYLEGIEVTGDITLNPGHNLEVRYCTANQIKTDGSSSYPDGIKLSVSNSIIDSDAFVVSNTGGSHSISGQIEVSFDHVYVSNSATLLSFNPDSYDTSLDNRFIFSHVTNALNATGYVIETPHSTGLTIEINNSLLPADSTTLFNSAAPVTINKSISYITNNSDVGAIVATESQFVNPGEIDIIPELGASVSIPRGYDEDSVALNYIDRHIDAGAFIERRYENRLVGRLELIGNTRSYHKAEGRRLEYQDALKADSFTFFMRIKPTGNFQETGVLFDSRYDGDYNSDAGLFNVNASDFIQIVYDNKTYSTNYLTTDKYSFKFVMSNNSVTTVAVIGPYFTIDDHEEFAQWHELGVQFSYSNTYTPKYDAAQLGTLDEDRKQFVIHTTFDRDLSRVYALRSNPFEDQDGNLIPTSRWLPTGTLSESFNIAGGWTADWISTTGGMTWTTWTPDSFNALIDTYLVSSVAMPVNALLSLGSKEVIDPYVTDYFEPHKESRDAAILNHCENPHPFSENGVEPSEDTYISFRQYEGWEHHALAVETQSSNFLYGGKFLVGDWFDRTNADTYNTDETITWDSSVGDAEGEIAVLIELPGGDLDLVFIDEDNNVSATAVILAGDNITEAKVQKVGEKYVVAYINSLFNLAFKTVNAATKVVSSEFTVSSDTINEFDFDRGHSNSQLVFTYWNSTAAASYIEVVSDSGTNIHGPVDYNAGVPGEESTVLETQNIDGEDGYYIFYRESGTDFLRFIMYQSDLSATYVSADTLITGEIPEELKSIRLLNNNIIIKWKDTTGSPPFDIKFSVVAPDGTDLVLPTILTSDSDGIPKSNDIVLRRDNIILFANRVDSSDEVEFKLYRQDGDELDNSPFLRNYTEKSLTGRVLLALRQGTNNYVIATTTDSDGTNVGTIIELDGEIPVRWYKDFTGIFDEFEVSTYRTQSLFGYALTQRFNHAASPGEGSIPTAKFVADAEQTLPAPWTSRVQTNGSFTRDSSVFAHGANSYAVEYDGSGAVVYATNSNITSPIADTYARFYLYLNKFFALTGATPSLEISQFGPGGDLLTLELVFNDPTLGGDGKYQLRATHSIAGTDTTASSVIDYLRWQYIDIRYHNDVAGGYQVWVDGSMVIDQTGFDTTASGNADTITVGSTSGSTPENGSIIYFDDVRVDEGFIGEYTIGLGQSDVWQPATITNAGEKHYISGYYLILSGNWILRLEGPALDNPIEFKFGIPGQPEHLTKGTDTVEDVKCGLINWDRVRRFEIGFIPDNAGDIEVHIMSTNSDDDQVVDDFLVDNIKLEESEYASSIDSEQDGYVEYSSTLDKLGNVYLRVRPEFRFDTPVDHYLMSAVSEAEDETATVTHALWYDAADRRFKFTIANEFGDTLMVQSDVYGNALSTQQLTDLNEEHHIVVNWDNSIGLVEMFIDKKFYKTEGTPIDDFKRSAATILGNLPDKSRPADALYDLYRFGEETLAHDEIIAAFGKMDPFMHPAKMNLGKTAVSALSFFGVQPPDEYTIYSEATGSGAHDLVIEVGENFADRVTIRHDGEDIAYFTVNGLQVLGSLQTQFLIAEQTTTLTTTDDHITLRFGFAGVPPETNDGYFEIGRGALPDSEIRWDESQDSWTVSDGTNNRISVNGTQIGTWKNNEHFNLVTNGIGTHRFYTDTTTDGGSGDGSGNRTAGTLRAEVATNRTKIWDDLVVFGRTARVAIGTETHEFRLTIDDDGGIIARGTFGAGYTLTTPLSSPALLWYPQKAAFIAGQSSLSNTDIGNYSVALGRNVEANGESSIAIGLDSTASAVGAVAIGDSATASGNSSIAMTGATASATNSLAVGSGATASVINSVAIGMNAVSSGNQSIALQDSEVSGVYSIGMGRDISITGNYDIAAGDDLTVSGNWSATFGLENDITANFAIAAGRNNSISGIHSSAFGLSNNITGQESFTFGEINTVNADAAIAGGYDNTVDGDRSVAIGGSNQITASGYGAIALGISNTASEDGSIAIGNSNIASGLRGVAIGNSNTASGMRSVAIGGNDNVSSGISSVTIGRDNTVDSLADVGVAIGDNNTVNNDYSVAFNRNNIVNAQYAAAFGTGHQSQSYLSFTVGRFASTTGTSTSWVSTDSLFIVGNGANSGARNNAFTVYKNGNATLGGILTADSLNIPGSLDFFVKADNDGAGDGYDVLGNTKIGILATAPISTTRSGSDITVSHDNSGVTAASYGSGTAIPNFTVNATGHIISAGTTTLESRSTTAGANTIMLRDANGRSQTRIPTSQPASLADGDIWVI